MIFSLLSGFECCVNLEICIELRNTKNIISDFLDNILTKCNYS